MGCTHVGMAEGRPARRWCALMTLLKAFGAVAALCLVGAVGFGVAAWRSSIDPITPPETGSFDAALVKRGAELAAIGNCNVCHTAAGGRVYAGGAGLPTPFGTIYSTNITPDAETGIGRWSEAAFRRAMRKGVDRQGRHLYPAFPYDHFTLVSDDDDKALYAFLMTREPVRAKAPANDLSFPLNFRPVIRQWQKRGRGAARRSRRRSRLRRATRAGRRCCRGGP